MESEKSMTQNYDSVFLIGFGGPTKGCCRRYDECPGEAFCYVENIVGNRSGGRDRIEEVSEHYKHFNGVSPFVFFSQKQAGALELSLQEKGCALPVFTGYRFWNPYVKDTLLGMAQNGLRRSVGIVLAPHKTKISWDAYLNEVKKANEELSDKSVKIDFMPMDWFDNTGYVGSLVADFHRNLLKGGVHLNPTNVNTSKSKLRLMYEANPLAYIIQIAGGKSFSQGVDTLQIEPDEIHQTVSLIIGNSSLVKNVK